LIRDTEAIENRVRQATVIDFSGFERPCGFAHFEAMCRSKQPPDPPVSPKTVDERNLNDFA